MWCLRRAGQRLSQGGDTCHVFPTCYLTTKNAISLPQVISLTVFHTVNISKLITETIPVWHMRNKQCVIFQFIEWNSNSYRWQQNIQLSEVQELSVLQPLDQEQITQGPAEIKTDHTPLPALISTEDIFFKTNLHGQISISTSHQKQNTKWNESAVKNIKLNTLEMFVTDMWGTLRLHIKQLHLPRYKTSLSLLVFLALLWQILSLARITNSDIKVLPIVIFVIISYITLASDFSFCCSFVALVVFGGFVGGFFFWCCCCLVGFFWLIFFYLLGWGVSLIFLLAFLRGC